MSAAEKIQTMVANTQRARDAGKQAEYEQFWNAVPGVIDRYMFGGRTWNVDTFRPNKRLACEEGANPQYAFGHHNRYQTPYDLAEQLEKYGGSLDFSLATRVDYVFYYANVTRLPSLDFSRSDRLLSTFGGSSALETIDKLIVSPMATYSNTFQGCTSLANITIEGTIGQSVNFQDCPLSVESMKSIIDHLKATADTDEAYAYTLNFSEECWQRLEASGYPMDGKYTGSWKEYVVEMYRWKV